MASKDRARALRALQLAAANVNRRAAAAGNHPMEVAALRLLEWARSRPDLADPVPFEQLPMGKQVPAGTPVIVDGKERYIGLPLEGAPLAWLSREALVEHSPLDLLLNGDEELDTDEEVLHRCRKLVLIQHGASGHVESLVMILKLTGHEKAAAMVEEQGLEDWLMAPPGYPSARQLLDHAFAAPEMVWERAVLEQACLDPLEASWPAPPEGTKLVAIPEG